METAIIVVFVLGYLAIAFEHTLKIDKLVPALVMMALIWAIISFFGMTVYDILTLQQKVWFPISLKRLSTIF